MMLKYWFKNIFAEFTHVWNVLCSDLQISLVLEVNIAHLFCCSYNIINNRDNCSWILVVWSLPSVSFLARHQRQHFTLTGMLLVKIRIYWKIMVRLPSVSLSIFVFVCLILWVCSRQGRELSFASTAPVQSSSSIRDSHAPEEFPWSTFTTLHFCQCHISFKYLWSLQMTSVACDSSKCVGDHIFLRLLWDSESLLLFNRVWDNGIGSVKLKASYCSFGLL